MKRAARDLVVAALAVTLVPATLAAQGSRRFFAGSEFRSMSFDPGLETETRSVSEWVMSFGAVWPVSQRLAFDIGTRYASATREGDVSDSTGVIGTTSATISGLTDTQLRAVFSVVPDVLVFTVTANLPTGTSTVAQEQLPAVGAIAHDLIPYPVSSFGNGASVTSGLAVAMPFKGWALGVGGSYRMSGSYRLFSDVSGTTGLSNVDYRPGAEMRVRVGLDRIVGQGRVALGVTYSSFAIDELGNQQVLQSGERYIGEASWSFPIGRMGVALYGWDMFRAADNDIQTGQPAESQNLLAAGAGLTLQIGRSQLRPGFEYRRHSVGGEFGGDGAMMSGSLRWVMPLGDRFVFVPAVRYDAGALANSAQENIGFTGLSGAATLRVNW
jgi:hypothetical protein